MANSKDSKKDMTWNEALVKADFLIRHGYSDLDIIRLAEKIHNESNKQESNQ